MAEEPMVEGSAADGSAEDNIALHNAVMQKLAENGGVVPNSGDTEFRGHNTN